jgi:hypothetical protein
VMQPSPPRLIRSTRARCPLASRHVASIPRRKRLRPRRGQPAPARRRPGIACVRAQDTGDKNAQT